jgi:HTH-type transcriptional regulator, competence development regulator
MSELGDFVRARRAELGLTLRELARRIDKSPAYLVALEKTEEAPGASEETLRRVAEELDLDQDLLLALAGKTPDDAKPRTPLETAIYRLVRDLSEEDQRGLYESLRQQRGSDPAE